MKSKTSIHDPIIPALKKKLLEKFPGAIKNVLLYGSRARGDFERESDYDLIILIDKASKDLEERICALAWDIGFEHHVSISVLVFEQSLFETDLYEPLFINVRREGIAV